MVKSKRTLLKSAPELWDEISDPKKLQRHLIELKDVQITSKDPQSLVTWRATDTAGEVRLAPSGWGTQVTLTARLVGERNTHAESNQTNLVPTQGSESASNDETKTVAHGEPNFIRHIWTRLRRSTQRPTIAPDSENEYQQVADQRAANDVGDNSQVEILDSALSKALDSLGAAHHRPFSRTA